MSEITDGESIHSWQSRYVSIPEINLYEIILSEVNKGIKKSDIAFQLDIKRLAVVDFQCILSNVLLNTIY